MPKKGEVSQLSIVEAILDIEGLIDSNGKVVGRSDGKWKKVATKLGDKLTTNHLYVIFHRNRYQSQELYRDKYGITTVDDTEASAASPGSSDGDENTESCGVDDEPLGPMQTYPVTVSPEDWVEFFKPVTKTYPSSNKTTKILPPFKWEDKLVKLITSTYKLPCAYSFRHSRVYTSFDPDIYIFIEASCNECGAQATGEVLNEPQPGKSVTIVWRAPDTKNVPHNKKRRLARHLRSQIGKETQGKSITEYRKQMANELMDFGDQEGPLMYTSTVLRKCKQEERDKQISAQQGTDVAGNLQKMKRAEPYAGSIHTIAKDPFFVHYFSPNQMHVYKSHCKSVHSVLALDATGRVVQRLSTPQGRSGHIFLYEGVIRTVDYQLPVVQMISEKQDANSILYWLNEWLRNGAPLPKEVVIDNSPALKSASVRAFTGCPDVAEYKSRLYSLLQNEPASRPTCYIRLDVNHFINKACLWDAWKTDESKRLKPFYMHCMGLLIKSDTIQNFEEILEKVLIVSDSTHEGDSMESFFNAALKFLSNLIKGSEELNESEEDTLDFDDDVSDEPCKEIDDFILEIQVTAESKLCKEGRLNPYYCPAAKKEFLRLGKDFVLWTATCVKLFRSPFDTAPASPKVTASSAAVEGDFGNLKKHLLRGAAFRADRFVAMHLNSIEGSCRIAGSKQRNRTQSSAVPAEDDSESVDDPPVPESQAVGNQHQEHVSDATPEDLQNTENWGGLALIPKNRKRDSRYLNPNPAMEVALLNQKLKPPRQRLLRNGNLLPFHEVKGGTQVRVSNTCVIDSFCQIICEAYINYQTVRGAVDADTTGLFTVVKSLAVDGATVETYKKRAEYISAVLPLTGAPASYKKYRNRSILQLVYDCYGTVDELAPKLLKDTPSGTLQWECDKGCTESDEFALLPTRFEHLQEGIGNLSQAVAVGLGVTLLNENGCSIKRQHQCKNGVVVRTLELKRCDFADLIFIDVDKYTTYDNEQPIFNTTSIKSVPVDLNIVAESFKLCGMIVRQPPNHFIALSRASDGRWQLFNDLEKNHRSASNDANVSPMCLAYVKL